MVLLIFALILLISPVGIFVAIALNQVGWIWSVLWIPAGSLMGGLLFAIVGAIFYTLQVQAEDRQTGPPEAGAIGTGLGRIIVTLVFMALFGWIGSGLGAFLAFRYLLP